MDFVFMSIFFINTFYSFNLNFFSEEDLQLQRLMERSGFTEAKAKLRISAQMPLDRKAEQANFVIENSSNQQDMREQTVRIINLLKCSKHHWRLRFILGFCCTVLLAGAYWLRTKSKTPITMS